MLFYLAQKHALPGQEVVDAGAFTGGSARGLAAGLASRPDRHEFLKRVHSFDRFEVTSPLYKRLLLDTAEIGDSFLPHYLHNVRPWADYVNVYPGDFTKIAWLGHPISILFCDICKTPALDRHMWHEFATAMVPGTSIMVQQDFIHIQAPFVHVALGHFHDHFDFLGIFGSSLVLRYREEITAAAAKRSSQTYKEGSLDEQLQAISNLEERIETFGHSEAMGTLGLVKAALMVRAGQTGLAADQLRDVKDKFANVDNPHYLARVRDIEKRVDAGEDPTGQEI